MIRATWLPTLWSVACLVGQVAAQSGSTQPFDFDFVFSYSGQSVSGRLVGLQLDNNGNATNVDPSSVRLFHVPAITGLSASPSQPYVLIPHTYGRSAYPTGTQSSTTPGVFGFQVANYAIVPSMQNLLMSDAGNDVTIVFNYGGSPVYQGGTATYGLMAEEDALWPTINTIVAFSLTPNQCTTVLDGVGCGPQLSLAFAPASLADNSITVDATALPANGIGFLVWGLTPINVPLSAGCNAYTDLLWGLPFLTDAAGTWSWSRTWPNSVQGSFRIQVASLGFDGQGALQIGMTDCLVASCAH